MPRYESSPEKSVVKDRDIAKANVDRLASKLVAAEAAVIATKRTAQAAALAGDDGGLDTAEAAEHAALRHLSNIGAAHAVAEKVLAALESQLATMEDKKTRTATAAVINELAEELADAAAGFDASIALLSDVAERMVLIIPDEARGMSVFAQTSRMEVSAAAPSLAQELRGRARAVLNGSVAATLPGAEAVPTIPAIPATVPLFATKAISWTDAGGQLRYAQRYTDVELPPETAARALKLKACLPIADPARKQFKGTWKPGLPDPSQCFCVDEPADAAAIVAESQHDDVVKHSGFVETFGKPYMVRTAGAAS